MSDERLREVERRWQESGSVEDEVAYLLERVRAGDLLQERLDLAAYLGHPAARIACDQPLVPARGRIGSRVAETVALLDWTVGLDAWGGEVVVQALVVVGGRLLLEYEPSYPAPVAEKIASLDAWGRCPCEEHLQAVRRVSIWMNEEEGPEVGAAWTAHHTSVLLTYVTEGKDVREQVFRALAPLTTSLLKPEDLRPMIRDALVPRALGTERAG